MILCPPCGIQPCNYTLQSQVKFGQGELCGTPGLTDSTTRFRSYNERYAAGGSNPSRVITYTDAPLGGCTSSVASQGDYPPTPGTCIPLPDPTTNTHSGSNCTTGEPIFSIDLTDPDDIGQMKARAQGRYGSAAWSDDSVQIQNVFDPGGLAALIGSRFKIVHAPSATCFLKAWYRATNTPDGGSPSVGDWTAFYTWTSTSNPCLDGCTDGTDQCLDSGWILQIDPPTDPGIITVEIYVTCDPLGMPPP